MAGSKLVPVSAIVGEELFSKKSSLVLNIRNLLLCLVLYDLLGTGITS